MYRVLGCIVALLAVLAFTASSSRAFADTPTGLVEFTPLSVENWEVEARKILAAQNIPEAEIERAIETVRAAQKASEEEQAGILQMIPLSDENWEAEARALLSKENRSKEEIDDVIEDIRKRKGNTENTDPRSSDYTSQGYSVRDVSCGVSQGCNINGFSGSGSYSLSYISTAGGNYYTTAGNCSASLCYWSHNVLGVPGISLKFHVTSGANWISHSFHSCTGPF